MEINWLEVIGYTGSVTVALSLMMKSIVRLRWWNFAGASVFALYGLLIGAYPVLALNGWIAVVDVYYLWQMRRARDQFEVLEASALGKPFIGRFLRFHGKDIEHFFPEFDISKLRNPLSLFTLRNMLPVGLFVAEPLSATDYEIKADYVIPDFRDLKAARFLLFGEGRKVLQEKGVKTLHIHSRGTHEKFLRKIGFTKNPQRGDHWYMLNVG